jgi:cysteine synthase A
LNSVSASVLDLIGNTPLLRLSNALGSGSCLYAKPEYQNPTGSIKDRMVKYVVEMAERRGELTPGATIVEASSGNTGVSVSMIAAVKGYRALIVVPDSTSGVKARMMKRYGAEIVFTKSGDGIKAVVEKARELAAERGAYMLNQFRNTDNLKAHRVTGEEVLAQAGSVSVFVAGVGTGGTLLGVAETLKQADPDTRIVALEPETAPALYNVFHGTHLPIGTGIPHSIEGIGETFVPRIVEQNLGLIDDVMLVSDEDAYEATAALASMHGLCVGVSSGANVFAAAQIAKNVAGKVVTVLPDSGQRYI